MKKLLLFLFILSVFPLFGFYSGSDNEIKQEISATYYICTGKYATKYHSKSTCRGLNSCKSDIVKTSDVSGRSACKICF